VGWLSPSQTRPARPRPREQTSSARSFVAVTEDDAPPAIQRLQELADVLGDEGWRYTLLQSGHVHALHRAFFQIALSNHPAKPRLDAPGVRVLRSILQVPALQLDKETADVAGCDLLRAGHSARLQKVQECPDRVGVVLDGLGGTSRSFFGQHEGLHRRLKRGVLERFMQRKVLNSDHRIRPPSHHNPLWYLGA
jgi:hypothetical protein